MLQVNDSVTLKKEYSKKFKLNHETGNYPEVDSTLTAIVIGVSQETGVPYVSVKFAETDVGYYLPYCYFEYTN